MSGFNFETWLQQNNIQDLHVKQALIEHNMTTLQNLSLQNTNLGAFLTDSRLITKRDMVQSIIVAIQTLDKQKNTQSNDIYIMPSPKEHEAMAQIQEYTDFMHDLKHELTQTHNKYKSAKISNNNAVERKHKKFCDELKKIQCEINQQLNRLNTKLNEKECELKQEIQQHTNKTTDFNHEFMLKHEKETKEIDETRKHYAMSIHKAIKNYKNKIVECKNIIKNHSINSESEYGEYHGSSNNVEREKKIAEIGQDEKKHYDAAIKEIDIDKQKIDAFFQQDLQLKIGNISYYMHVNKELYQGIANNINSLCHRYNINSHISQRKELQITVNKQKQEIISLNKEIKQLTNKLDKGLYRKSTDYIRPFKLWDSKLWNVISTVNKRVISIQAKHTNYHSSKSSMLVADCERINGYNEGVHKWSVQQTNAGQSLINGEGIRSMIVPPEVVRSIGVISPRRGLKNISLVLADGAKWGNTGPHFDGQSGNPIWGYNQTMSVVLNCTGIEWKVLFYKTEWNWNDSGLGCKTTLVKQDCIAKNRSYYFALVINPSVVDVDLRYMSVKTPKACKNV